MTDLEWNKYIQDVAKTVKDLDAIMYEDAIKRKRAIKQGLTEYENECKVVDEIVKGFKDVERK